MHLAENEFPELFPLEIHDQAALPRASGGLGPHQLAVSKRFRFEWPFQNQ